MRLPDRIWVPAAAAFALALIYSGALLVRADGDASLLVHAAPPWTSVDEAPDSLTVQAPEDGFDGQFFYRNAAEPLSTASRAVGVEYDLPALRSSRVGYSALAWVTSAGDPDVVPWSLLGVNLAAATALGAAGGMAVQHLRRHAAWGLALVLWPGFAYTTSLDTAELVASALGVAGLVAVWRRRWGPAVALLAAAALTRETALVYAGAAGLAGLVELRSTGLGRGSPARAKVVVGAVAIAVWVGWQAFIWRRFDEVAFASSGGSNNLGPPLAGLVTELGRSVPPGSGEELYRLAAALGLVALLAVAGASWRRSGAPLEVRLAWVPSAALVILLNDYQWSGATAFLRGATEAGLMSTLVVLGASSRALRLTLGAGLAAGWAVSAVAQLTKLG